MPNTLNNLIPDAYAALDIVSRELIGFIPGVSRDSTTDNAAKGQSVRIAQTRKNSAGEDITPAMAIPSAADQTIDNVVVTIDKYRAFPFSWSGEEQKGMNEGPGYNNLLQDQIAQALRAASNEMEADIANAAAASSSRAYGTSGTVPFGTSIADTAQARKILDDNGAPLSGRSLVIDTAAGANLRTLQHLTKANEAGTTMTLRDGELLNLHGFSIRESAQVARPAVGTGAGFEVNGAHAVGATTIAVNSGTGTILAGDVVTIGGNKYVVATALSGGSFTIAAPGLIAAAENEEPASVNAVSARNVAFCQNSIILATRLPVIPQTGDLAIDRAIITDPRSGISFGVSVYPGYHMARYQIEVAWGVKVIKPEHTALLLG